MWKEYSISYIKNNKITSVSLMVAALISSMFLSLITGVFYNMWIDNIKQIATKEGDWQAKITGSISEKDSKSIQSIANVKTATEDDIWFVQTEIEKRLSGKNFEIENRVEEEQFNEEIQKGYTLIMGGLCGLLAIIGLANVFSNTLGYIYQRKREFARYLSIGLSPQGMKKILCMEALIIGGKPIMITVPLTIVFVIFATTASYINPMEFLESMPIVPLFIFACMILGCVALAYYIGGRKICRNNIIETLKNDVLS